MYNFKQMQNIVHEQKIELSMSSKVAMEINSGLRAMVLVKGVAL